MKGIVLVTSLLMLLVSCNGNPTPAGETQGEAQRIAHDCHNEHYLLERKPVAELTSQDLQIIRYCKSIGEYHHDEPSDSAGKAQAQQDLATLKRLDTPQMEHDIQTQLMRTEAPRTDVSTGRLDNQIIIDTNGCATFEEFDRLSTTLDQSTPGCIDLDRGAKVIGPLEVKVIRHGTSEFRYARIEVPGKGGRWTFLNHLQNITEKQSGR